MTELEQRSEWLDVEAPIPKGPVAAGMALRIIEVFKEGAAIAVRGRRVSPPSTKVTVAAEGGGAPATVAPAAVVAAAPASEGGAPGGGNGSPQPAAAEAAMAAAPRRAAASPEQPHTPQPTSAEEAAAAWHRRRLNSDGLISSLIPSPRAGQARVGTFVSRALGFDRPAPLLTWCGGPESSTARLCLGARVRGGRRESGRRFASPEYGSPVKAGGVRVDVGKHTSGAVDACSRPPSTGGGRRSGPVAPEAGRWSRHTVHAFGGDHHDSYGRGVGGVGSGRGAALAEPEATTPTSGAGSSVVAEHTNQRNRRRKKCPSPTSPSQSPQLGGGRSPCCDAAASERPSPAGTGPPSLEASSENAAVGDSQGSLDRGSDSSRSSQLPPLALPASLLSFPPPSEGGTSPRPSPEGTREPLGGRSLDKSSGSDGKVSNKLLEKKKKTSSWYNMLNPTYKSRSEDFKRLFKDLPETERLIVDYSCALQRDILVHGRLYVTQNFICFYANIFRWETNVVIRCRDVTSMTKEKTARVIPNAVQVCTDHEKHFFTSFGARDKTYLMLFRIWQNALMEQPMSTQELWQWVHYSYGDELGLTSDDDDYVAPPYLEDEARRGRLTAALKAGPQSPSPFVSGTLSGLEACTLRGAIFIYYNTLRT
ncbi:hypothetical protein HPB48_003109 [Haemaphysalis longicornis]|uniref:GRAM domain-containing protein n=1 Tax=Haemaphysalis longicornis TaxID=44386 RepID=A0A9J6FNQ3_HAELO|nr:hypothetical protein HPB48_003109 [Haemaphysalis longicornis]